VLDGSGHLRGYIVKSDLVMLCKDCLITD